MVIKVGDWIGGYLVKRIHPVGRTFVYELEEGSSGKSCYVDEEYVHNYCYQSNVV